MTEAPDDETVHRELDTDVENPGVLVAEVIEELEGRDATDLATMYSCVDGMLDNLFSTPPSPDAEMLVEFTYEGYRITVEQSGDATFVKAE